MYKDKGNNIHNNIEDDLNLDNDVKISENIPRNNFFIK